MPTELVLLSEIEPSPERVLDVVAREVPGGQIARFRDGDVQQVLTGTGVSLLTLFRSEPVEIATEAAAALTNPPTAFSLWTDLTVPFGDDGAGRRLADALAAAVGGSIHERQ